MIQARMIKIKIKKQREVYRFEISKVDSKTLGNYLNIERDAHNSYQGNWWMVDILITIYVDLENR